MKDTPDFLDSEYNQGAWEHDIAFTTAPGHEVDVAAGLGCRRQDKFLGTKFGALRRHRLQSRIARRI